MLSDDEKRKTYDQYGEQGVNGNAGGGPGGPGGYSHTFTGGRGRQFHSQDAFKMFEE